MLFVTAFPTISEPFFNLKQWNLEEYCELCSKTSREKSIGRMEGIRCWFSIICADFTNA